jgi:hypothetical protein
MRRIIGQPAAGSTWRGTPRSTDAPIASQVSG